jgi:hypothetical protein
MAGRDRRRALRRWAVVGAAAAVSAVVILKLVSVAHERSLASDPSGSPVVVSRVEGGTLLDGGYLSPSGRTGVTVRFSEGSTFTLTPGTRGQLRALDKNGAHLAVHDGTVSLGITPSPAHRWSVEAGPFLVTVKGTVFTVSWDALNERFELRLRRGRVLVTGPVVNGGLELRAGQRLVVSLPRSESVISDEPPEAADGPPEALAPGSARAAAPPSGARQSSRRVAVVVPKATPGHRWAADLASGHWDRILAEVERDGVDATLENAPSEDLFALADAARYRRRGELARAALLAQRRRFPRAPRSLDAVFLLGRAEELREQGTEAQAIAWYDEYLALAPSGPYAAEALGRKMILTKEMSGAAQARPIAREYLLRFPAGSYAGSARALERAP